MIRLLLLSLLLLMEHFMKEIPTIIHRVPITFFRLFWRTQAEYTQTQNLDNKLDALNISYACELCALYCNNSTYIILLLSNEEAEFLNAFGVFIRVELYKSEALVVGKTWTGKTVTLPRLKFLPHRHQCQKILHTSYSSRRRPGELCKKINISPPPRYLFFTNKHHIAW